MRVLRTRPRQRLLCAALLAAATTAAHADSGSTAVQFWPEVEAYHALGERSRMLATAAVTRDFAGAEGGVTTVQQAQFTINVDYTLAPPVRTDVPEAEWSQNRLLWGRLGYAYDTSGSSGANAYHTSTVLLALNWRQPLHDEIWLRSRARVDFRDVDGESSQRYRLRSGIEWELSAFERRLSPYAEVEFMYDTRYDKWSRATLKTGFETLLGQRWRVEPYLALELNKPEDDLSRVVGIGLVFKYYFVGD